MLLFFKSRGPLSWAGLREIITNLLTNLPRAMNFNYYNTDLGEYFLH